MSGRASRTAAVAKKPLLVRLLTWFSEAKKPKASPGPHRETAEKDGSAAGGVTIAPLSRMTVAQWLWGDGFVMPGDAAYVLELVKPFGLTPAMSTLDLSAGLGGPSRVIAQAFGTYVTGLERSPERAKRGMEMSTEANLAKRATIIHYDPESLELRANSFDCVIARGSTYNVVEKERLLRVVHQGMKQRSQLVLNEFVIDPVIGERPEIAAWMARETHPPVLWTVREYADCLTSLGFDIRVAEDITTVYRSMIVAGWARLLNEVDLKALAKQHRLTVIDEAELWMRRIAALECGALKVFRIYALLNKPSR
jgi:cyclopropane fatty-acyl-phospholipid synthase-like methyltransferase